MTTITWICFGLATALSILSASLWVVIIHLRNALDEERMTSGYLQAEVFKIGTELADFRFPNDGQRERVES